MLKILILLVSLVLLTSSVFAQPASRCAPTEFLHSRIQELYNEEPSQIFIADGMIVEILTNEVTQTWTILTTKPDGISCMEASGTGYLNSTLKQKEPNL